MLRFKLRFDFDLVSLSRSIGRSPGGHRTSSHRSWITSLGTKSSLEQWASQELARFQVAAGVQQHLTQTNFASSIDVPGPFVYDLFRFPSVARASSLSRSSPTPLSEKRGQSSSFAPPVKISHSRRGTCETNP
jgi:hypothetical protein